MWITADAIKNGTPLADGDERGPDGLGQVVFFVAVGGRCMKHGVEVVDAVQ